MFENMSVLNFVECSTIGRVEQMIIPTNEIRTNEIRTSDVQNFGIMKFGIRTCHC
jgi:hypothetical protein